MVYPMVGQEKLQKNFGKVLKSVRTQKSYSQEGLALECGLDRTYISLLERGLRQPSLASIFSLAHALDIKASSLIKKVEREVS